MLFAAYITHALLSIYVLKKPIHSPLLSPSPVSSQTHPCQLLSSPGGLDQLGNQQEWRGVALIELMVRRASAYEVAGFGLIADGANPESSEGWVHLGWAL